MSQPKITLVGAGGMSFGPAMVNDVVHTPSLAGSRLVLHDVDAARLRRRAVIEDPCSPADEQTCGKMFDELRSLQAEHPPF